MANSKDYRVRLGERARKLAMDHHGRVRAWHLERAIEDLQNKPVEKGEEQLRILKEQLVEFNVQLKTANTVIAIIVSELTKKIMTARSNTLIDCQKHFSSKRPKEPI